MNSLGWALRCCSGWHLDRTQSSDIRRRCTIGLEIGRAQSELQSRLHLVCRLLLEKKKKKKRLPETERKQKNLTRVSQLVHQYLSFDRRNTNNVLVSISNFCPSYQTSVVCTLAAGT